MRKMIAILLVAVSLCGLSSNAFARDGYRHGHYSYREHEHRYYRSGGWWGLGGFIAGLAAGSALESLPPRCETVLINGVPYYYCDGYYYQAAPAGGYVVIAPPR